MDLSPAEPAAPGLAPPSNDFLRPPIFAPLPGGWWRRFGFRWLALFFAIYAAAEPLGFVPGLGWLERGEILFWKKAVPWFGREVLRLHETVSLASSGSGDKLFDWVQFAAMLASSLGGALVWVWFDRARRWDGWVAELLRLGLRYVLGAAMLSYGISKILHQQMSGPGFFRLLETYGESSPMGLAWTFMGQSWAYSAFAGGLEFLGGLLLFFRRTTTLGALLLIAVMTNVLMMNLCFDIPVKLYSAELLVMACVIAAPAARRLGDTLLLHRATAAPPRSERERPWPGGRFNKYVTIVKFLLVANILWLFAGVRAWRWFDTPVPVKSEFYGLYEVEKFTRNSDVLPPLLTDRLRWRRVTIDERNFVTVIFMDDHRAAYRLGASPKPEKLTLQSAARRDAPREEIAFHRPAADQLVLEGKLEGAALAVTLKRASENKLLLINRGFHWINEVPFNR